MLNRKHLGWSAVKALAGILAGNLARGQTNTLKMLWKFNSVYNPELQLADHQQPVRYEMAPPPEHQGRDRPPVDLRPSRRKAVAAASLDDATETFVDQTRMRADAAT